MGTDVSGKARTGHEDKIGLGAEFEGGIYSA